MRISDWSSDVCSSDLEEAVEQAEGVGAVYAGQHRRVAGDRQHLVRHLHDDLVGIAVGEKAGTRAAAGHAVAPGIVDHDEGDAAGLLAIGRPAGSSADTDDRDAPAIKNRNSDLKRKRVSVWVKFEG